VFITITIVLQSRGLALSHLFPFIFVLLLFYLWCWSLMDHHVSVLSPINISLWMLLFKYKGVLRKGQQHSKGFEFDNNWKHPGSTTIEKASMHLSFFFTTLNLHHHNPFECALSFLFVTFTLLCQSPLGCTYDFHCHLKPPLLEPSKVQLPFPLCHLKPFVLESSKMHLPFPLYHSKPSLPQSFKVHPPLPLYHPKILLP